MFKNLEGKRIPDVTLRTRRDHEWEDDTSDDVSDGKNVGAFSRPGAITPTCSWAGIPTRKVPALFWIRRVRAGSTNTVPTCAEPRGCPCAGSNNTRTAPQRSCETSAP